jgi:hypothetical protein
MSSNTTTVPKLKKVVKKLKPKEQDETPPVKKNESQDGQQPNTKPKKVVKKLKPEENKTDKNVNREGVDEPKQKPEPKKRVTKAAKAKPQEGNTEADAPVKKPRAKKEQVDNPKKSSPKLQNVFKSLLDAYSSDIPLGKKELKKAITSASRPTYGLDVAPSKWTLPNRAKFVNWVDVTFKKRPIDGSKANAGDEQHVSESVSLFNHQKFIKDYLQFSSPYRGLLLYHGLGVGKSCSSIAAAEILTNHMDVIVMTPASLRDNYLNEIKKCGRRFFNTKQHWVFLKTDLLDTYDDDFKRDIQRYIKLDNSFIKDAGGIWVPIVGKEPNYEKMPRDIQTMISEQIDAMINKNFQFINYNGLSRKKLQSIVDNAGGNPFDNKCIVIDEIHNLISTICNGSQIGEALYKLMMKARNSKFILLSGTPIINYPHEIAYMINLITGPRITYEIKAKKNSIFELDTINELLNANKYIDWFELDLSGKRITISFLPEGFAKANGSQIAREAFVANSKRPTNTGVSNDDRLQMIINDLSTIGIDLFPKWSTKESMTLPTKEEDFNNYFVDFDSINVKNGLMFMRRILGVVSYYSTYSQELYPSVDIEEVPLYMNDFQFSKYEKARGEERLKEKRNKGKGGNQGNLFSSVGQVYRFYSRALCNFVFPEGIDRPFPSKLSQITKEFDVDTDEEASDAGDMGDVNEADKNNKNDIAKEYQKMLNVAIGQLRDSGVLKADTIAKYSPKFKAIYEHVINSVGNVLIYSQFRKVEGLGVMAMCLEANGFAEFKIKKVDNEWDIDIDPADFAKPKYMMFTGSNDETKLLLKIYNSDFEGLPKAIVEKLPLLGGGNNFHGELIKVLMITKSGAEGISLKNVRQVHVIEPYWNHIRMDQVIGRAVRTKSHFDLPRNERNVKVYIYYMQPTKQQIDNSFSIRSSDKEQTSDQHIYNMAKKKARIVNAFLDLMKKASVDCAINAKHHGNLRCFSFPVNIEDDKLIYKLNIATDTYDSQYKVDIQQNEWRGEVYTTSKGKFLLRSDTNEIYDYDLYVESGRLVKLGTLKKVGTKITISS